MFLQPIELVHVHSLVALEQLTLDQSFTQPLDEDILSLFAIDDALTRQVNPNLRTFNYQPPVHH